jgi:hypothetical protein
VLNIQPVRSAYQPPAINTFLSEQTSHQQPASNILLSEQTSTSHQPSATSQPNSCPLKIEATVVVESHSCLSPLVTNLPHHL